MYSIQNNNNKIEKIIKKYYLNEINNFIIISKIKNYSRLLKEYQKIKNNFFDDCKIKIKEKNNNIKNIDEFLLKERRYLKNYDQKINNLNLIIINTTINFDILLLNYSILNLNNKILINQFYKHKYIFFKNKPITIININKLKIEYRLYVLEKTKKFNSNKKQVKIQIHLLNLDIKELEKKIYIIREKKKEFYKKNNIICNKNIYDTKEIYDLKNKIILKKKKIDEIRNKKIEIKDENNFKILNLDKNQKLILPIINNNNVFKNNIKNIFIRKIKDDIELSNKIINKYNILLDKEKKEKEYYNNLNLCKIIDNTLKNKCEQYQKKINKLEHEIIKDYLVLNRKK